MTAERDTLFAELEEVEQKVVALAGTVAANHAEEIALLKKILAQVSPLPAVTGIFVLGTPVDQ